MARKAKFTERIPATPCTPDTHRQVVKMAEEQERSIADVVRDAVEFFLSSNGDKNTKNGNIITKKVQI